jgi:hypothetical protein
MDIEDDDADDAHDVRVTESLKWYERVYKAQAIDMEDGWWW